jgi:hypothetical protein
MSKYSYRETVRFSLAGLALLLAFSSSLLAQERSAAIAPDSASGAQSQLVELASVAALPSAPSAAAFGGESAVAPMPFVAVTEPVKRPETHVFWDRQNKVLFVAVAAAATADFFTTRANLANGGRELNPVARIMSGSTPGLAANFALETGASIGISYLFHKTGHHALERMTSVVNISASAGAVAYGQTHR